MLYKPGSERELAVILKRERFKRSYHAEPGNIKEYIDSLRKDTVRGQLKEVQSSAVPHKNSRHKSGRNYEGRA